MIDIAVVAHPQRLDMAANLTDEVGGTMLVDVDSRGCAEMHVAALKYLCDEAKDAIWLVVLEDDAIPVPDFRVHATEALMQAPGALLVNFYLGTGTNTGVQDVIRRAIDHADQLDVPWIHADCLMSTVGYAVHRSVVQHLLDAIGNPHDPLEVPKRITHWAQGAKTMVRYTWPSLVDHRDGWSVIAGQEITGRVAHRHGIRPQWNASAIEMGNVPGWSAS